MTDLEPAVPSDSGSANPAKATVVKPPSRGRSIAAIICLVLAALLTTPGAVAYWGQRTLNDTQRYVETVGPLVNSPEVQDVLAKTVTDAIDKQVDIEGILNDVFADVITDRPRLEKLVGPLSASINSLVEREVRAFIASDAFADLWTRVNTRAQQALERLLKGEESGAIKMQGDEVVLDVGEVIDQVKERLVARGLTMVENVPIPETDKQIVLLDAPQLKQVRNIYAFANPIAVWLLPLVALLYLAAFLLSRRRPPMTVAIGALVAVNALVMALALSVGRSLFVNELAGTVFGPASTVFYDTLLAFLDRGVQVFGWLGVILVVAGLFAGSNKYGTAARTTLTGGLERTGAELADTQVGPTGRWVADNARWLRIAVGVFGVVILLWGMDVSLSRLIWSLVLVLVLLAIIQILTGAGRGSATPPPPAPTEAEVGVG